MHIRTPDQLQQLTQIEYWRWREGVATEIALQLAQAFTTEELSWVVGGKQSPGPMWIMRAGYHLHELKRLEEQAVQSVQDDVFYRMADFLRCTFHQTELVHMDGDYDSIFVKALAYCSWLPKEADWDQL